MRLLEQRTTASELLGGGQVEDFALCDYFVMLAMSVGQPGLVASRNLTGTEKG